MRFPRWGIFYDFHTMPACPDVGKEFDCDATAEQFVRCGVDFVVFHARCNLGMAYYNTKIGIRHPSLHYDLLKKFALACHQRGIMVSAYLNVGLSHEEGLRHREWTTVEPDGRAYGENVMNSSFRKMCYNTGYAEHLLGMVGELLDYPIDGFFFDCFAPHPCQGVECITEMKKLGMDSRTFAEFSQLRLMKRLAEKVRSGKKKDYLLYFNGVPFRKQAGYGSYLEFECLPTGGWGYEALPLMSRYTTHLGVPVLNMTGRFHRSWGDFGGIRTRASLLYDCVTGISHGMRTTVGDHFHPRGDLNMPVYDLIADIYGELRKLDPWLKDARPEADTALIVPQNSFDYTLESGKNGNAAGGFCRMLSELKYQFDVLTPDMDFSKYRLLFLSDEVTFSEPFAAKIETFIRKGGKIVSSFHSGLNEAGTACALPKLWPDEYLGTSPHHPAYFTMRKPAEGVPEMPVAIYGSNTSMKAKKGCSAAATVAPYYNKEFHDGHAFLYLPPDKPDGTDFLAMNGSVAQFSNPIGNDYFEYAQIPMRNLLASAARKLLQERMLEATGLPSFGRATVTSQPGRKIVWLTAFVPERRGKTIDMIEEGIPVKNASVSLKAGKVKRVYLAPSKKALKFTVSKGRCIAEIPEFTGYCAVVFEE